MPAMAQAIDKNAKPSCIMYGATGKEKTKVFVGSTHGFTVFNNAPTARTYHVEFSNHILYGGSWYSPNIEKNVDVVVRSGETYTHTDEHIRKDAYFGIKGNYPLKGITRIYADGKYLNGVECNHVANIFK